MVDWELYISRESLLHMVYANTICYSRRLQEELGLGIKHQAVVHRDTMNRFYMSGEELAMTEKRIFDLMQKRDPRFETWYEKALRLNKQALKELDNPAMKFEEFVQFYEDVLLFGTIIPYRILAALERAGEQDNEKFVTYRKQAEELRSKSYYPLLSTKIFPIHWKRIAKEKGFENWEVIAAVLPEEFSRLDKDMVSMLERRNKACVIYLEDLKIKVSTNKGFAEDIGIPKIKSTKELKGQVACKGHVKGRVRIINRLEDAKEFQRGDILVSINTNPSLMPIIEKSAGIVTDEGGIACHAAIVSREFGIACVIGTKNATTILRDGDLVEVDANNGIVRKIDE